MGRVVDDFFDYVLVGVAVGGGDVDEALQVFHVFAQFEDSLGAEGVEDDCVFQIFVESGRDSRWS